MLLVEGKPMTNYKDLWPLYHEFLKLKNILKKHWNDFSNWEIMEHLHNQVLASIKVNYPWGHVCGPNILLWIVKVGFLFMDIVSRTGVAFLFCS
jgi:hypothetical protein